MQLFEELHATLSVFSLSDCMGLNEMKERKSTQRCMQLFEELHSENKALKISPVISKKRKKIDKPHLSENEESKMEILSLAPFTPNPKIAFENVLIGSTQVRKLQIRNPSSHDVDLIIKKSIPDEINLVFSWTEITVPCCSNVILEMVWGPSSVEACRHTFTVTDGKRINRDVGVIFKSVALTKTKSSKPKIKSKSPIKTVLKRKSPAKNFKSASKSGNQKALKASTENLLQSQDTPWVNPVCNPWNNVVWHTNLKFQLNDENFENKENCEPLDLTAHSNSTYVNNKDSTFISGQNATFPLDTFKIDENERRETFILEPESKIGSLDRRDTFVYQLQTFTLSETKSFKVEDPNNSSTFRDSLEESTSPLPLRELSQNVTVNHVEHTNFSLNSEYKLKVLETFSLSPRLSPYNPKNFYPSICSTTSKPFSTNNSLDEKPKTTVNRLFPEEKSFSQLNLSGETYTKENLSGGTYTKLNISNSIGDLNQLDISPSSTSFQTESPIFYKPKSFECLDNIDNTPKRSLSAIAEESTILNEPSFRNSFKRKSSNIYRHSSPKRANIQFATKKSDWSKEGAIPSRIAKKSTGLNLQKFIAKDHKYPETLSCIKETKTKTVIVQNPFLFANIIDPFMTSQIYCNEEWIEEQVNNFKKWLNALLTPPDELNSKAEGIDVAKVWQDCKKSEVKEAPSKETLSLNFHSNSKLDCLRKQAQNLYRSKEVSLVLQKVCIVVETGKLSVRDDKDIHLNLKLKSDLITLILNYNPLWLRIGLETIYNEVIPLKSNSDTTGLIHFLMERFFKDPSLMKKHKSNLYAPKYAFELKKFVLKKFLCLVYFLDKAKMAKLMQHDPCLFCKNAEYKESRLLLIHFARETLSAVGDITKYLRILGFSVTYVQTYIHEFDYAVKNLGVDLRDGVRLARIMEIIQMRDDLTTKLRVPAISRLQKVHNMQVVFQSLKDNKYEIQNDISAKDIVDGHKEKTLSFLWQMIYKFEAPLMVNSASTIQTWFKSLPVFLKRRALQRIYDRKQFAARRIQEWYQRQKLSERYRRLGAILKEHVESNKREKAAIKIQAFWKRAVIRRKYIIQRQAIIKLQGYSKGWLIRNRYKERILAAVVIQKNYRKYLCHKRYLRLKSAILFIQKRYRCLKKMRSIRENYLRLKQTTIFIQQRFRANLLMKNCRTEFILLKNSSIKIQSLYRMKVAKSSYLLFKRAVNIIQMKYRAQIQMKITRGKYLQIKRATAVIQEKYRAKKLMEFNRNNFILLRNSAIKIQSYYKMYRARKRYFMQQKAINIIQVRYRALVEMRTKQNEYLGLKKATTFIQRKYRAKKLMEFNRNKFILLRNSAIKIQSIYKMYAARKKYLMQQKTANIIQVRYRALVLMRTKKKEYLDLKKATTFIQSKYRAKKCMEFNRNQFVLLKSSAIKIQSFYKMYVARKRYWMQQKAVNIIQVRYRALVDMKTKQKEYLDLKKATKFIQSKYRAKKHMEFDRNKFVLLKNSAIKIQSFYKMYVARKRYLMQQKAVNIIQVRYRALVQMKTKQKEYLNLKKATTFIQRKYRANKLMALNRNWFILMRNAAIKIQSFFKMYIARKRYIRQQKAVNIIQVRYKALIQMRTKKKEYLKLKEATTFIQRKYRAKKLMVLNRNKFVLLKSSAIKIQSFYKMYIARKRYLLQQNAAIIIQARYRAQSEMKIKHKDFLDLKKITIFIQAKYRAKRLMQFNRYKFILLRNSAIKIQSFCRMYIARKRYLLQQKAVSVIQRWYLAQKLMITKRREYIQIKQSIVLIQQRFRAHKLCNKFRLDYVILRKCVLIVQRQYRAKKLAIEQRKYYETLKGATTFIQRKLRANREMKLAREDYLRLREATILIQRQFRANQLMKKQKGSYNSLKRATLVIQRRYKANKLRNRQKTEFLRLKSATICIQRRYRAHQLMIDYQEIYCRMKWAVLVIQRRYRAHKAMVIQREKYIKLRIAIFAIQGKWKATLLTKKDRAKFLKFKESAIIIQTRFKGCLLTRKERTRFLVKVKAISTLQRHIRGYLIRKKFSPLLSPEAIQARKMERVHKAAATKIQAFWRGYTLRKSKIPELITLSKRKQDILKIQNKGPSMDPAKTLGQRCEIALVCMYSQNSTLLQIIKALEDLDFITRHCQASCMRISMVLPDILYTIISTAARSPPDMDACNLAALILINFFKYSETRLNSWKPEHIDSIINVSLHWCDKEAPLFSTLCTLLWLFAHQENWRKVIVSLPNLDQRMHKIQNLVYRKQSMVSKSHKCTGKPSYFGPITNRKLPTLTAHWGLDYDKANVFTNAVFALDNLIKILEL